MRDDTGRLQDILDAINLVNKSISKSNKLHEFNELEYLGIVRCIEIIGEACNRLSNDLKQQYPQIPWKAIVNMRNILIHEYFDVDHEKIEEVIKIHLPELKETIELIILNL